MNASTPVALFGDTATGLTGDSDIITSLFCGREATAVSFEGPDFDLTGETSDFVLVLTVDSTSEAPPTEGFGTVAMIVNFIVSMIVSRMTPAPPEDIQELVEHIRIPSGAGEASGH